ncbi:MAG: ribokinase [Clostridiaceae bacterium]|nr:ribokinase [Clostridiaceae bacterium]
MKILNFGSLNIDYVYNVDHIIVSGETLSASDRNIFPGGKGLNQSVAFARAGANVWHAGNIGKEDGGILLDTLKENSINTDYLQQLDNAPSGHTVIQVDKTGLNCILVYGGANSLQTRENIDNTLKNFSANDYLILQNEINDISYIMEKAKSIGMKIILNPSPIDEDILALPLDYVDVFMVNEIEAAQLVDGDSDEELLDNFVKKYPDAHTVMTIGSRGAHYAYKDQREFHGIFDIKVVDSTAAGDTFTGYFIQTFAETNDAYEALRVASAASTLAVSRAGASTSIPYLEEVEQFLAEV